MGDAGQTGAGATASSGGWERCKEEVKAGRMSQGQAQDARHDTALKVQGAWSGGCKRPVEMGGAIFVVVALTPYGGGA